VRLTVDGKSSTQPIVVKIDPRVRVTPAIQQIFTVTTQMEDGAGTNPGNDSCLILAIRVIRGCTLLSNAAAGRGFSLGRDHFRYSRSTLSIMATRRLCRSSVNSADSQVFTMLRIRSSGIILPPSVSTFAPLCSRLLRAEASS